MKKPKWEQPENNKEQPTQPPTEKEEAQQPKVLETQEITWDGT